MGVAKKRLQNKKRKAAPKKPVPPDEWFQCPYKETLVSFFWAWLGTDCDPAFTPDGKPWIDQDQEFWRLLYYLKDVWDWAVHRAANPVMGFKPNMPSIADL